MVFDTKFEPFVFEVDDTEDFRIDGDLVLHIARQLSVIGTTHWDKMRSASDTVDLDLNIPEFWKNAAREEDSDEEDPRLRLVAGLSSSSDGGTGSKAPTSPSITAATITTTPLSKRRPEPSIVDAAIYEWKFKQGIVTR